MLKSKRYTRYKITSVFREAAAQIRIKGATKQKAYLPALSEGKGQREGRILSKSTLPLLPSEPNGACLHSCSSCGKWLRERCWSLKSSCSWENKTSKGKSWLQCQHMGKKNPKNKSKPKNIKAQLSSEQCPFSLCPGWLWGPLPVPLRAAPRFGCSCPAPAFTYCNTAWVEMNSTNVSLYQIKAQTGQWPQGPVIWRGPLSPRNIYQGFAAMGKSYQLLEQPSPQACFFP